MCASTIVIPMLERQRETGIFLRLTGLPASPTAQFQDNERPCFKKQGGWYLNLTAQIVLWSPQTHAYTFMPLPAEQSHTYTTKANAFSYLNVVFLGSFVDVRVGRYISHLSVAVRRHHDQGDLQMEEFPLAYSSRGIGVNMAAGTERGGLTSGPCWKERE